MRKLLFALIIFSACQREVVLPETDGNNRNDTTGSSNLLTKIVSVSDEGDSTITNYSYDTHNRIISRTMLLTNHTTEGYYYTDYQHYYRDEAGRIVKISGVNNNGDTAFTEIKYEGATTRIMDISNSNEQLVYDSLNRIIKVLQYRSTSNPGDSLQLDFYSEFFYSDSGNLVQKNDYNDTNKDGILEPNLSYKFTYDNKINPLKSHDDVLIVTDINWMIYANNNVVKWDDLWLNRPTDVITYNFTYREDDKPASCKHFFTDGATGNLFLQAEDFYYYQ